ncbi:hypothetical protein EV424DRAFT_1347978 [Suillus variegatus]|nr:hypothetical protein EV424DRAFT_1347978 [Suillus variegatus]
MPSLTLPECPHYIPPPETKEDLEFADLPIIDLSKVHTPEGRAELYPQLRDALRTHGFLYAINHGYKQAQRDRIFDIAGVPFNNVSPDEKKMYTADVEKVGYYAGYKPRQFWKVDTENQILDQIEHYAINLDVTKRPHPTAVRPFLPELDDFARHNHFNILHPILRLIALSLELPEETLVEKHNFNRTGETSVRFMKYYRRSNDEEEKSKNVWLKGHTDIGSITILWSQPIGGLQIMAPDGKWKWVRHIDNGLADTTSPRSTVSSSPPPTNAPTTVWVHTISRCQTTDIRLLPCAESPVLQRAGIERQCLDDDSPSCETWRKGRTTSYGRTDLKKGVERGVEEEVIEGIVVKHYN